MKKGEKSLNGYRTKFSRLQKATQKNMLSLPSDSEHRYAAHYLWGLELSDKQKRTLELTELAASLLRNGYTEKDAISLIIQGAEKLGIKEDGLAEKNALAAIERAKDIFGDLLFDKHKELRRWASIKFFDKIADKALELEEYDTAIRAKTEADKLSGVHTITEKHAVNPEDFTNPDKIILVPSVDIATFFSKAGNQEIQDVDFLEDEE